MCTRRAGSEDEALHLESLGHNSPPLGLALEPLAKQVARAKARWLHRLMVSNAKSNEKVFGYLIFQHLNCVTLDAWPSQDTLRSHMHCCARTIARAADGLEAAGFIVIDRPRERGSF